MKAWIWVTQMVALRKRQGARTLLTLRLNIWLLTLISVLTVMTFSGPSRAYDKPSHRIIAYRAADLAPAEMRAELSAGQYLGARVGDTEGDREQGDNICEGAWEEDECDPLDLAGIGHCPIWDPLNWGESGQFPAHYFDPDSADPLDAGLDVLGLPKSPGSLYKAIIYWTGDNDGDGAPDDWNDDGEADGVMPAYHDGRKGEAYYWLGRIVHLLTDCASPSHTHLIDHSDVDTFEEYTEDHQNLVDGWALTASSVVTPGDLAYDSLYVPYELEHYDPRYAGRAVNGIWKIWFNLAQRGNYFPGEILSNVVDEA